MSQTRFEPPRLMATATPGVGTKRSGPSASGTNKKRKSVVGAHDLDISLSGTDGVAVEDDVAE